MADVRSEASGHSNDPSRVAPDAFLAQLKRGSVGKLQRPLD